MLLNVSHLHCAPFPCRQDLPDALVNEAMPAGDAFTIPPKYEIELNQLPLQIRPVMFLKSRHLTWETDTVATYRLAELIDPQVV